MWMRVIPTFYNAPVLCPYSLITLGPSNFPYHYYTYRLFHHHVETRMLIVFVTCVTCACILSVLRIPRLGAWLIGLYNVAVALHMGDLTLALTVFGLVQVIEVLARYMRKPFYVWLVMMTLYSLVYLYLETYTMRVLEFKPSVLYIFSGWMSNLFASPRLVIMTGITLLEGNEVRYPEYQGYVDRAYNSGNPALDYIGEAW